VATTKKAVAAGELAAASAVILDFTNVKDRGDFNPKRKAAGDYKGKIVKVQQGKSQNGNMMWVFTVVLPGDSQASYPYRCVLDEANAWKIRQLFMACGMNVPKKRMKVDPNKAVGKFLGLTLEDDEYEGKTKSVIAATFPVSELPSTTSKKTTRAAATTDDDEEEEEIEEEDEDEMEVDEVDEL
jgi:hypothetical protein